jgi:hypothetical protein
MKKTLSTSGMRLVKGEIIDVTLCHPTLHVVLRMFQRNIVWTAVLATILHGQEISVRSPRVAKLRGFGLDVLLDGHRVVTVHSSRPIEKKKRVRKYRERARTNRRCRSMRKQSKLHKLNRLRRKEATDYLF